MTMARASCGLGAKWVEEALIGGEVGQGHGWHLIGV
jgi:hypothetical protein